jgi:hypothetical protein
MLNTDIKKEEWIHRNTKKETIERWEREKIIFINYIENNGFPSPSKWDSFAKEHGYLNSCTFSQRLGNWNKVALYFNQPDHAIIKVEYTDEELIDYLLKAYKDNKSKYLYMKEYISWGVDKNVPDASLISRRLGRGLWKTVLKRAGIERIK